MDLTSGIVGEKTSREIADVVLKSSAFENIREITEILKRKY